MPLVEKVAQVPYTPEQMFDLVSNVDAYPDFIPWCTDAHAVPFSENTVDASLVFSTGPLNKTFTTRNTLEAPNAILLHLVDGPFKTLEGAWRFNAMPDGCEVRLGLSFTYANRLIAGAIGLVFEQAVATMLPCFIQRAKEMYGD